jgi:hypothetical protein
MGKSRRNENALIQYWCCVLFGLTLLFWPMPVFAAVGGVSANYANGVILLGDGGAGCSTTTKSAIRYNSATPGIDFCNGTAWISLSSMRLIGIQTASSSTTLQFTSLPTTYNTLYLDCDGLLSSTTGAFFYIRIGESTGPTWETGAHYTSEYEYSGQNANNASAGNATGTDMGNGSAFYNTIPSSIKFYIGNTASTTTYKMATFFFSDSDANDPTYETEGSAYWNNDKNAVTGLQISASTGTIASGTCNLYGLN